LAYDMFAVFDRYRSEKRNILVGHSYGWVCLSSYFLYR
jgi:pimeloyl-ACP methyl ester carboxylesterase